MLSRALTNSTSIPLSIPQDCKTTEDPRKPSPCKQGVRLSEPSRRKSTARISISVAGYARRGSPPAMLEPISLRIWPLPHHLLASKRKRRHAPQRMSCLATSRQVAWAEGLPISPLLPLQVDRAIFLSQVILSKYVTTHFSWCTASLRCGHRGG